MIYVTLVLEAVHRLDDECRCMVVVVNLHVTSVVIFQVPARVGFELCKWMRNET